MNDTDQNRVEMLIEEAIISNQALVQTIKESAENPGKSMSTEEFTAWLDKPQH